MRNLGIVRGGDILVISWNLTCLGLMEFPPKCHKFQQDYRFACLENLLRETAA
jgi:hypothetical protein